MVTQTQIFSAQSPALASDVTVHLEKLLAHELHGCETKKPCSGKSLSRTQCGIKNLYSFQSKFLRNWFLVERLPGTISPL